jgi:hypothetical protein
LLIAGSPVASGNRRPKKERGSSGFRVNSIIPK